MEQKEYDEIVSKAAKELATAQLLSKEAQDQKITGITVLAAIGGFIIPIVGVILGLFNLVKGRTAKGFLYLVLGIGGWIVGAIIMFGSGQGMFM